MKNSRMAYWTMMLICTAICLLPATPAFSEDIPGSLVCHITYGELTIANDDPTVEGGDYRLDIFGADVQKALGPGALLYGFETGMFFSIDSEVRSFHASSGGGGGVAAVAVDVESLLFDYFLGGFVGIKPAKWLRLYAGAGPLLIYAQRDTEPQVTPYGEITDESDSGFGAGVYARAGIDLFFTRNFGISGGARINQTTVTLDNTEDEVDVEGWQYYVGAAFYF
ncbi:MAG: hypothetical protein HZB24_02520 [Desulfobacterales bacterium]|nr:hypothetical protein [Desulfobacterales bacterium]